MNHEYQAYKQFEPGWQVWLRPKYVFPDRQWISQALYFVTTWHDIKRTQLLLPSRSGRSDDEAPDLAFLDGEQLEDDEELRLHIHGCNSFFTKWIPQLNLLVADSRMLLIRSVG